jgi:ABC-type uncharacterized transport system involved in gliding motility auxiliary subunit/ABC-type transport system involved in multi-copper enzyme maturation permease subunit
MARGELTSGLNAAAALWRRDVAQLLTTPLAWVYGAIYLLALGTFAFEVGRFFETNSVDLTPFFAFHPWISLLFVPALAMRSFAEELRSGRAEGLLALPVPVWGLVVGKWLAVWTVAGGVLAFSLPVWAVAAWLGPVDHGVVGLSYAYSLLLVGVYAALGVAASAFTANQVLALVVGVTAGFLLTAAGLPAVSGVLAGAGPAGAVLADVLGRVALTSGFEAALRGVLEVGAVGGLAVVIAASLGAACLALLAQRQGPADGSKPGPTVALGLGTLSLVVAGLSGALISARVAAPLQADVSAGRLYTLSPGTRSLLANLESPLRLELVLNRELAAGLPQIAAHARRVEALLGSYARRSGGRLTVVTTDPEPFSEAEDAVVESGLTPVPTEGGDPLHFGLIGRNGAGDTEVLAYLAPERDGLLEYDLTRLVAALANPERPVIAVATDLASLRAALEPASQGGEARLGVSFIGEELARRHDIRLLAADFAALPDEADLVILAQGARLTDHQADLIDQFVLDKGRLLAFRDPAVRVPRVPDLSRLGREDAPGLGALYVGWGVDVEASVVADTSMALPVRVNDGRGGVSVEDQPLFLAPPPANMSRTDVITAPLGRAVHFGAPGGIGLAEEVPPGVTVTPLIFTGDLPGVLPAAIALTPATPAEVRAAMLPLPGARSLAVRLQGRLQAAYDSAPPLEATTDALMAEAQALELAATERPRLSESQVPVDIVLVADLDLLEDGYYVNPQGRVPVADNAAFVLNAVEVLLGQGTFAGLTARAAVNRPMARVDALRSEARARLGAEQAALEAQLALAEEGLAELEATGASSGFFTGDLTASLTDAEADAVAAFRAEILDIRTRLRAIERGFRAEINRVRSWVMAGFIWLPPLVLVLVGLGVWAVRTRQRRRP